MVFLGATCMVQVEVLQGGSEIGGNCIRIRDRDRVLVFDQGLRFKWLKKLYGYRLRPSGPDELREVGVLPSRDELAEAEALYITHFHFDHLGLLGDLPDELVIKVPSVEALILISEWYENSPDWTAYVPPRYAAKIEESEHRVVDKRGVMALRVPHSSYPSVAYLYFGDDENILYTGDFRFDKLQVTAQLYPHTLFDYFEENPDIRIDKLIVEGTNFGRPVWPLSWEDSLPLLKKILSSRVPLFIALHRLEFDLFMALYALLRETGRRGIIASKKLLDVVELWASHLNLETEGIFRAPTLAEKPSLVELAGYDDLRDPSAYTVIADLFEVVDFARGATREIELQGGIALLMVSEHEAEEGVEEAVALGWLRRLGLQPYRLRVSGHYYPHEFAGLVGLVKPREIVPIHTEEPGLMLRVFEKVSHT